MQYQAAIPKRSLAFILLLTSVFTYAQGGWTICNSPDFMSRVDDLFMVNAETGYAVCGDGKIVKTTDGGNNWITVADDKDTYCRSVEFVDGKVGFAGGFPADYFWPQFAKILRKTEDGGTTWTDLTQLLHPRARQGICGLAAPNPDIIYGCGNWFFDTAYIVKSSNGGNSWDYIDMSAYASKLIDIHFISNEIGFVTGSSPLPLKTSVILYTTDGGKTWSEKFKNTTASETCWKIQQVTDKVFYASIQGQGYVPPVGLKSIDFGMTWTLNKIDTIAYRLQGIGFIDPLKGWAGGLGVSYETNDGGITWDTVRVCPIMNRVFRVNDTLLFATGSRIWKYTRSGTGISQENSLPVSYASMKAGPNPANELLTINTSLSRTTHVSISLLDQLGQEIRVIENALKPPGDFLYTLHTSDIPSGIYYLVMQTHEDYQLIKVLISH